MSRTVEPGDVVEQVEARLEPEVRAVGADLARIVLRRHPHGLPADADIRAAVVAQGARLLAGLRPGELALQVYNPDGHGGTMVAVVVEDAPFLMSTLARRLERAGLAMANHAYPEFGVERAGDGSISALRPARGAQDRHTWIHVELDRRLDDSRLDQLAATLTSVLDDVQRATGDFAAMRDRATDLADDIDEDTEAHALLRWLLDDHFVFLGAIDHHLDDAGRPTGADGALGILRDADGAGATVTELAGPVPTGTEVLTVSLTHERSTVHRHERMIDITVRPTGADTVHRTVGLFAKKATSEPVTTIPVLRRWVDEVTAEADIVAHSHDERMLRSVLEALPKDALFTARTAGLAELFDVLVRDERATIRVAAWTHAPSAAAVIVVAVPRSRFDAPLREQIDRRIAGHLGCVEVEPFVGFHEEQALLTYVLQPDEGEALDLEQHTERLRAEVVQLSRTWGERLLAAAEATGVAATVRPWSDRLPATYRDAITPDEAVRDCRELAALADGDADVRMRMDCCEREAGGGPAPVLRFKLYRRGSPVELSRFVPILESLGLVVVESVPHVLLPGGATTDADTDAFRIHDYGVRLRIAADFDVEDDGDRLADAASAVWSDKAEADSLNQLVLLAGLHWLDVAVIRAYRQFRRQVGTTFTAQFQNDALCAYPEIARALMEYFVARFRPDMSDPPASRAEDSRDWLLSKLEEVNRLDQDRILRGYLELIDATVRTNRYREPVPARIALKFDSSAIPDMPKPVPYREIFVYSPRMEGVHLRGGPVARGGVRWSDRQEDFRTEVLGLMKAQMVKNAVIVPTGSKGGFVLKGDVPADGTKAEVRRQYESYIRGLFDVTDTIADGEVRHPDDVRCHDGEDAYLVVAADRGTAALSDVANGISAEYGFWLGDAFASGGSQGYDHKDMGITARGAWVAVQHHFRELGIDVQREPITITGIGDMSGDVFGNGLLRSRAVKLVAAFDHRDVVIDPDPDPEASYAERRRLFERPGATWQDYDREVLSAGGGVWSRTVKRIELTDEIRDLIRVDDASLTPPELIRALLRAPVDLLFAGGIGTFVKASSERDADVGDRANDAVRVDADQIGARVIGEGGNLAVTQRGRMQYARRGGRINLDAIDNAAGVDTSDREVNLKILLGQAIDGGQLDPDERDQVLADVTDDVAERVLADVAAQTRLLSEESGDSASQLDSYEQLMRDLESSGRLDRTVEALPDADEIERRQQAGGGLTRPELGLLIGYAKSDLAGRLADSDLPADPSLEPLLERYFPPAITERFADVVLRHRLRDQLVAMLLANDLVNHMGSTAVSRAVHQLGCGAPQVSGAYWIARQVSGAADDWSRIEALDDTLEPALQRTLKEPVDALVASFTRRYASRRLPDDLQARIDRDRAAFVELEDSWPSDAPPGVAATRRELVAAVTDAGVDGELAWRLVTRPDLAYVPDIADIAEERDRPVAQVAEAFVQVGRELPLDRIWVKIDATTAEGRWQQWEQKTLLDEVHGVRRLIARQAMDALPDLDGADAVAGLLDERTQQVERVWSLMAAMAADEETTDLAQASVTMSALRTVLE